MIDLSTKLCIISSNVTLKTPLYRKPNKSSPVAILLFYILGSILERSLRMSLTPIQDTKVWLMLLLLLPEKCQRQAFYYLLVVKLKQSRYRPGVAQRVPGS